MIYKLCSDLRELDIDKGAYIYLDTETIGLYGRVRLVQLYQSHWDCVMLIDAYQTDISPLGSVLSGCHLVMHNGIYDVTCLANEGVAISDYEDTFLLGRLHYLNLDSFSLDCMLTEALGSDPYALNGLDKKQLQKAKWDGILTDEQLLYSALDVFYLPKLFAQVHHLMESPSYMLDKQAVKAMIEFSKVGIPVDATLLNDEKTKTLDLIAEFAERYPDVKPNSPKQMKEVLNCDGTSDKELARLASDGNELAQVVRDWRKAIKKLNFIEKFNKPRVYGYFNVATKSGRSNCSNENLQQIPSSLKHLFQTDKFFVYADFSNLELRTFCAMVGERVMERMFRDDVDLHTYSAHKLFKVPMGEVSKTQRQIAKTFNFSSLYGAGVAKRLDILLANTGIALELEEGQELAKEWLAAYPSVKQWQSNNYRLWSNGAVGYTALKRPYISKLYTDFGNLQVQGSGAEVAKLALVYMLKVLKVEKLCAFIHDSYTFEVDTFEEAQHYAEILAKSMQQAWFEVSQNFKIVDLPMPVLASVGKNWKALQADQDLLYTYEV